MRRLLCLSAASVLVGASLAGPAGLPGPAPALAASPFALTAGMAHVQMATAPPVAGPGVGLDQAIAATDSLAWRQGWAFSIANPDGDVVTDPAITVDSGWSPALFPALNAPTTSCPVTITRQGTAFPFTWTDSSLAVGETDCPLSWEPPGSIGVGVLAAEDLMWEPTAPRDVHAPTVAGEAGIDSFRSLDTTNVGPGATQHMVVGFTTRDAEDTVVAVDFWSLMTPERITAITSPAGVPDCPAGPEPVTTCLWWYEPGTSPEPPEDSVHYEWVLLNPRPGVEYRFGATFTNVTGSPVSMIPQAEVNRPHSVVLPRVSGSSVHHDDASLGGPLGGPGAVDFSIGAGQVADWNVESADFSSVIYEGTMFDVPYVWNGFFAPVDNPGSGGAPVYNVMKAGAAVPVRFSLGGDRGLDVVAGITADQLPCSAFASLDGIEATVAAGQNSLSYHAGSDTYTYVWKTDKAWSSSASTCRVLDVKLDDGTHHRAYFKFTN